MNIGITMNKSQAKYLLIPVVLIVGFFSIVLPSDLFAEANPPATSGSDTNNVPAVQSSGNVNNTASQATQSQGQVNNTKGTNLSLTNPLNKDFNSIGGVVNAGINIFTYLAILFAVLAFIWVGLKYIMAQGNPAKVTEASKWLLNIVIGVAILIAARLIISIVINTLQATGVVKQDVVNSAQNALNGTQLKP